MAMNEKDLFGNLGSDHTSLYYPEVATGETGDKEIRDSEVVRLMSGVAVRRGVEAPDPSPRDREFGYKSTVHYRVGRNLDDVLSIG